MDLSSFLSIVSWVVTGSIAGYVASLILRAERQGCLINIVLGIIGAFVGAFLISTFLPGLANIFGTGLVAGFFNGVVHAIFGAVVVLIVVELALPGKQLGVEDGRGRRRRRR